MPELTMFPEAGAPMPNRKTLGGFITIGASGAITAQTGMALAGATFVKNASAGRYDVTFHRGYKRVTKFWANICHPSAGTAPTLADGNQAFWQGITAAMMAPGSTPTPLPATGPCIQCTRTDSQAAANPTSGISISWGVEVSDS